jgi:excisionase family DNA binding protein
MTETQERFDSPWMTSKEVCALLGVSDETLMRYRQSGRLKFYRLTRNVLRYHREDIDAFIRSHAVRPKLQVVRAHDQKR